MVIRALLSAGLLLTLTVLFWTTKVAGQPGSRFQFPSGTQSQRLTQLFSLATDISSLDKGAVASSNATLRSKLN